MAVTISTDRPSHPTTFGGSETLTQSTATAFQALDPHVEVSFLGMGTASGDNSNNLYSLTATGNGDAVEGMEKFLIATATGEAAVYIEMVTGRVPWEMVMMSNVTATVAVDQAWTSGTGNWVFSANDDWMHLKFMNGTWKFLGGAGPTQATAT